MVKISIIAAAFALIGISTSQASDMWGNPASDSNSWGGVYIGGGVGAGSLDYDLWGHALKSKLTEQRLCEDIYRGICVPHTDWVKLDGDRDRYRHLKDIHVINDDWSIFGTVQIGIDQPMGQKLVVGAFADFDLYADSGNSFSMPWVDPNDENYEMASLSGNVELDSVWSVGGRIGVLVTPRFLLYGMGGYTQANIDGNLTLALDRSSGTQSVSASFPDELSGYFVGGGGEIKLRDNLSLKLEYRYSDFDSVNASASKSYMRSDVDKKYCIEERVTRGREAQAELDAELHSVRAVLVHRFNFNDKFTEPLK